MAEDVLEKMKTEVLEELHNLHSTSQQLCTAVVDTAGGFRYKELLLGAFIAVLVIAGIAFRFRQLMWRAFLRDKQAFIDQSFKDLDADTLRKLLQNHELPSWITFPDMERAAWCNDVVTQLWPRIRKVAASIGAQYMDPLLEEYKPSFVNSIRTLSVDLGDQPPSVTGMKVFPNRNSDDEVILEFDWTWGGNQRIGLLVKPLPPKLSVLTPLIEPISNALAVKSLVEHIIASGRIRVSLSPLMNDFPVVAAAQVSLVDQPKFSFNAKALGGDMALLPGFEQWLYNFIRDQVMQPYILPERLTIPLVPGHMAELQKPKGMLCVKLIDCEDVPKMDLFSESDPFVTMYVRDSRKVHSTIKKNSKNPLWNEDFQLLIHEPAHQKLTCILYDWDLWSSSDEIGRFFLKLSDIPVGQPRELWLDLQTPSAAFAHKLGRHDKKVAQLQSKQQPPERQGSSKGIKDWANVVSKRKPRLHLQVVYYELGARDFEMAQESARMGPSVAGRHFGNSGARPSLGHEHEVHNVLRGGVLYVNINRGFEIVKKPLGKLRILGIAATARVAVGGQVKKTAEGRGTGEEPIFDEQLEFVLGGDVASQEDATVDIEVWDYRFFNHFKGRVAVPLKDIIRQKKVKNTYPLDGVKHGQLSVELQWMGILQAI